MSTTKDDKGKGKDTNDIMAKLDEREELLREAACLGKMEHVQIYVSQGVNVNARNKINGWTPLHWASHRDNAGIAIYLLRHGGDLNIENKDGKKPVDMAKSNSMRTLLGGKSEDSIDDVDSGRLASSPFVPNYLRAPTLDTGDLPDVHVSSINHVQTTSISPSTSSSPQISSSKDTKVPVSSSSETTNQSMRYELLVYIGSAEGPRDLKGSIIILPRKETVHDLVKHIFQQLDLPKNDTSKMELIRFSHRHQRFIPINRNQFGLYVDQVFGGDLDYVVIRT